MSGDRHLIMAWAVPITTNSQPIAGSGRACTDVPVLMCLQQCDDLCNMNINMEHQCCSTTLDP